jgi:hypothetical protein
MMKYRKHILTAIFAGLLLVYAGDWLLKAALRGPLETRRAKTAQLKEQVRKKEDELTRIRKAGKQLLVWQSQSLPSNIEVARSLYQAWLLELVDHVGMVSPNVDSAEPVNRKGIYHVLSFTVRGRGTLEQLTKFLFEFYRAGQLHQIRGLDISPMPRGHLLELSITIEALALPGLKRVDRLSAETSDRLVSEDLDDYRVIVERNLLGTGGGLDAVEHTRLTAVTSAENGLEAWFSVDSRSETLKLHEGDALDLGSFRGTVAEIVPPDVILESDGQRWLMTIGESLSQASALPPEF